MKKSIIFDELQGRVKMMSIYRASDAPPDWLQEDPNHPGYIHNKPEFVAGDNIEITQEGRSIIISAKGTVFPDGPDQPDVPDVPVTPDEPSEEGSIIERIIINKIPAFLGVGEVKLKEYQLLDGKTAEYTDEGFYVAMEDGIIKTAGYQLTLEGTEDEDVGHTMLIISDAKIVNAYQYLPAMEQWFKQDFEQYWVEEENVTQTIEGVEYPYTKYVYNVDMVGSPIVTTEYWRFEIGAE